MAQEGGMRQGVARSAALLLLLASAMTASARSLTWNDKGAPGVPNSLQPDVLNLDACPDCVTFPNADDGLGYWKDSKGQSGADKTKKKKKNAANSARVAVLSSDELDSCSFDVEEEGRYCANGYVAFVGSCRGDYQSNLTATSTQQKRRKTVTTEKEWSPATDATAPFTVVLISRPFGDPEEAADCSTLPYQTYFTISRDEVDFDSQMLWKNREITLYSYEAGFALDLLYGSSIPCPTPNKWRMEVLTRDATGTAYTYYRYTEGEQPIVLDLEGKPVTVGADQLALGYDKRNGAFGSPEYLDGDIAVLSMYNRQLTAEEVESLAQFYSCRFNFVTENCPEVEGYTVAANVDHKGDDLGCQSFHDDEDIDLGEEGATLCDEDPDCVGFNTWVQGGKAWTCPKSALEPVVAMPPEKAFCTYTKNVETSEEEP